MPLFTDIHPSSNESYESMLDNLDQPDVFELSDWEANFLDSMLKLNGRGGSLTDAQAEKIRQMAEKYLSC
jgi:hypothetical protein